MVFQRRKVFFAQAIIQTGRVVPAVGHAHRGAADQVVVAVLLHVARQSRPQQRDHRAAAIVGVDARAPDLDQAAAQVLQPGEVEFVLGVVAANLARGRRGEDAIGADDAAGVLVAHDEVLAEGVVDVSIHAGRAGGEAGAHLVGEDAIAQLLGLEDLGLAGGETDMQVAGLARGAVLARLDVLEHGVLPSCSGSGHSRNLALRRGDALVTIG